MNKPVFLVDLDDTLFQTQRKMRDELGQTPFKCGAIDRSLQPRSFMNEEQSMLVDWLLENADTIPVTARGTEEIGRVTIPFDSWAITTHGAVILTPDGTPDPVWQDKILTALAPYRRRLIALQEGITALFEERNIAAWARINEEYDGHPVYLVMKHTDSTRLDELYSMGDLIEKTFGTDGFYLHRNGNNIAWLPTCIEKGVATRYLLDKLKQERGCFPVLGLGDSISDHRFLQHCTWFGMPNNSQMAKHLEQALDNALPGIHSADSHTHEPGSAL